MNKLLKVIDVRKLFMFLGILFLFLFLDYIFIFSYYLFDIQEINKITTLKSMIFVFAKYFVLIGLFFINYRKYLKQKIIDFKNNFVKYFKISVKNWFLGFIIMIISNIIINSFIPGLGKNEEGVQQLITEIPIIAFIMTTVFAPFVEEMIFRKYLQDAIKNKTAFMILSGLIFGLVHVMGFDSWLEYILIIPYGALGFMFAKTLNETDNIYSTIMMHMLHNGVLTLLSIWVI